MFSAFRHDPDIIMVGEIRDLDTAKIAIRAALTGHLVMSTVHAVDTVGTIQRLIELGISKFDLKETLVGVIAQRLINIHCPKCGQTCKPSCSNHKKLKQRTAIFEILTGLPLHDTLSEKSQIRKRYKRLDDYYRQATALGFLEYSPPKPIGEDHVPS